MALTHCSGNVMTAVFVCCCLLWLPFPSKAVEDIESRILSLEKFMDDFSVVDPPATPNTATGKYQLTLSHPAQQAQSLKELPAVRKALRANPNAADALKDVLQNNEFLSHSVTIDLYTNGHDAIGIGCESCLSGKPFDFRPIQRIPNLGKFLESVKHLPSIPGVLKISSRVPISLEKIKARQDLERHSEIFTTMAEGLERCTNKNCKTGLERADSVYDGAFVDKDSDKVMHEHEVLCWWELPHQYLPWEAKANWRERFSANNDVSIQNQFPMPTGVDGNNKNVKLLGSNSWRCRWRYAANLVGAMAYNVVLIGCMLMLSTWITIRVYCKIFSHWMDPDAEGICVPGNWGLTITTNPTTGKQQVAPTEVEGLLTDVIVFVGAIYAFRRAILSGDLPDFDGNDNVRTTERRAVKLVNGANMVQEGEVATTSAATARAPPAPSADPPTAGEGGRADVSNSF